jgi:ribonuclease Z
MRGFFIPMATRRFELTTLGTGAALPARGRYPTAQLLHANGALYLIDCGEGTQERLREAAVNFQRIGHILISHLHGDHYLGLMGLISSMHLMGRKNELFLFGPPELKEIIDIQLRASGTYLRYPLRFQATVPESGTVVFDDGRVTATVLALKHRIPCTGFLFTEHPAPRTLRRDKLTLIPHFRRNAVKAGEDLVLPDGTLYANAELTYDPPPVRRYAYCSDTAYEPALIPLLQGVDLLYHEATFTKLLAGRAKETMHSTAAQAAQLAREAGVKHLLLGHFSSRYKDTNELLEEAQAVFPATSLSYEGGTFPIGVR